MGLWKLWKGCGAVMKVVNPQGTASSSRVEFFVSRNEATVGKHDPSWALIAVGRNHDETLKSLGWCRADAFIPLLPNDSAAYGRWMSARVSLPIGALIPGLPLDIPA